MFGAGSGIMSENVQKIRKHFLFQADLLYIHRLSASQQEFKLHNEKKSYRRHFLYKIRFTVMNLEASLEKKYCARKFLSSYMKISRSASYKAYLPKVPHSGAAVLYRQA